MASKKNCVSFLFFAFDYNKESRGEESVAKHTQKKNMQCVLVRQCCVSVTLVQKPALQKKKCNV